MRDIPSCVEDEQEAAEGWLETWGTLANASACPATRANSVTFASPQEREVPDTEDVVLAFIQAPMKNECRVALPPEAAEVPEYLEQPAVKLHVALYGGSGLVGVWVFPGSTHVVFV